MKHSLKSRNPLIARFYRWLDRRQEWKQRPRITPYEARLWAANEEYKFRWEQVITKR